MSAIDYRPGDEIWLGRVGISESVYAFPDQQRALAWMENGPLRRIWQATLATAVEHVLEPPQVRRLVPRGQPA